jgi:hypothetical protein
MTIETATTIKAVSAGGLGMMIIAAFNDVEFVMLFITGAFASTMSYFYDWAHREPPVKFRLAEAMELFKSIFYGIPMMFLVYHYGVNNTGELVNVPVTVWGFIAMVAAGSAVAIVEFFAPIIGGVLQIVINKKASK